MSKSSSKDRALSNIPEVCKGCFRWDQWKHKCSFFWKNKKECGSKVNDHEEMISLDQMRRLI